jgi:TRAP-type C4-dicarboxylate transport system permease small subunit
MKLIAKVTNIFDRTIDLLAILAIVLLIFTMLSVSGQVIMRYSLERSAFWIIEVNEYALLYITFLGTAWVLKREGHVKMDVVLNRLTPGTQSLLYITTSILGAIICLLLTWYGAKVTWEHFQIGYYIPTLLKPPKFLILAIIPVGSFLLFIQFLRRTYGFLRSRTTSQDQEQSPS